MIFYFLKLEKIFLANNWFCFWRVENILLKNSENIFYHHIESILKALTFYEDMGYNAYVF